MLVDFGGFRRIVSSVDMLQNFPSEFAKLVRMSEAVGNQVGREPDKRAERHRFIEGGCAPVLTLTTRNAGSHHDIVLHRFAAGGPGARGRPSAACVLLHMPGLALTVLLSPRPFRL